MEQAGIQDRRPHTLQVFLNGACVLRAEDDDPVLAKGKIALRTWNSGVRFRNVKVTQDGTPRKLAFRDARRAGQPPVGCLLDGRCGGRLPP